MVSTFGDRTIAVTGATGLEGGGLVRAILRDPWRLFSVRAVVADLDSAGARELHALGAQVVVADLDDADSLVAAFEGAYGAFCVTDFWEHGDPEREELQAANLAHAAKTAALEHVIWLTMEDTRERVALEDSRLPTVHGHYKVGFADAKGFSNRHFVKSGVPTTLLYTSFYWEDLARFGMGPRPGADGVLELRLPLGDAKLPAISGSDVGGCAFGVFRGGTSLTRTSIGLAAEHLTGAQLASGYAAALRREVRYAPITPADYRSFDIPGAADLANLFQFIADFQESVCGMRTPSVARHLNRKLLTFADWLALYAPALTCS